MKRSMAHLMGFVVGLGIMLGGMGVGQATTTTFTSEAAFLAAIAGLPQETQDFESILDLVIFDGDTVDGITFEYTTTFGEDLMVSDQFDTTSGENALGTNFGIGTDETILGGDGFKMTFDQGIVALGLFGIFSDVLQADDFTLTIIPGGGSVSNTTVAPTALGDGGLPYYLGIIDTDGFTMAEVTTSGQFFAYTVDDITTATPEPGTLMLLSSGLLGLGLWSRRRLGRKQAAAKATSCQP